mmetsp:Transcript_15984/g.48350  ORF Transcript_15984/g.48350 Transcript_15984/m.48350 type:complete len:263 (-) Transcript_15984:43-831(-)
MLLLEASPCAALRHGPSHVLEWRSARYELSSSSSSVVVECTVEAHNEEVSKRFRFDGTLEVAVRELAPTADDTTGLGVWDAAIALAALCATTAFPSDARVLELGCGCGLPSATLAARGARVLATDGSQALVDRLRSEGLNARRLRWDEDELEEGGFGLVLGAEILYAASAVPLVARLLRRYARDAVWLVGLARRRPLLDALCHLLRDDFHFNSHTITLAASSRDPPGTRRVTVDDLDRVNLLLVRGTRTVGPAEGGGGRGER